MAKDLSFSTFLDEYDTDFFDYLSKTSTACHSETRYKELTEKIKTLYEQYPNVRKVLDVDRPCELSAEDCTALVEVLKYKEVLTDVYYNVKICDKINHYKNIQFNYREGNIL